MTNNNPESQQECCEKCRYPENGDLGQEFWSCSNSDCPCHTPAPTQSVGWEEEFDEKFVEKFPHPDGQMVALLVDRVNPQPIKSFIRSLLTQKEQEERERVLRDSHSLEALGYTVGKKEGFNDGLREERERVLEMIEGMQLKSDVVLGRLTLEEINYNQALSDLRDRITNKPKEQ